MNFLDIDFTQGATKLFKEAFKFKKYKAMPLALAILVGIFQIPAALVSFVVAAFIYVLDFIIKLIAYPFQQLHGVVRREKDEVKGGAQVIIYLVSWPSIFFFYALLIFATFILNIAYILLALNTYLWSLGGFRFHLLIANAKDIEIEVDDNYKTLIPLLFVIGAVFFVILLPIIKTAMYYISLPELDKVYVFKTLKFNQLVDDMIRVFKIKFMSNIVLADAFIFLYTLLVLARFPKKKKEEEIPAVDNADIYASMDYSYLDYDTTTDYTITEDYGTSIDYSETAVDEVPATEEAPAESTDADSHSNYGI